MTALDWKVYEYVKRYTETHHCPPEGTGMIARALGCSQVNAWKSVERWVRAGYMERERGCWSAPVVMKR